MRQGKPGPHRPEGIARKAPGRVPSALYKQLFRLQYAALNTARAQKALRPMQAPAPVRSLAAVHRRAVQKPPGRGWMLAGGIIEIILGIILIFNVALSAATLPIFLGFWLMLRGFSAIGLGGDMNAMEIPGSGWTVFSGILLVLCSLWILFQPLVFGTTAVVIWVGISLLFAGIAACSLSIQLRRAHQCLGNR